MTEQQKRKYPRLYGDQCQAIKKDGTRCTAASTEESGRQFCVFHTPSISDEERAALRSKGGHKRRKIEMPDWFDPSDYLPYTPESILKMLADMAVIAYETYDDDAQMFIKVMTKEILPKASEWAALKSLIENDQRLKAVMNRLQMGEAPQLEGKVIDAEYTESNESD